MQHNVYLEWSINGKAYFQSFRALCRMRIAYAQNQINYLEWETEPDQMFPLSLADAEQIEKFWTKDKKYWEKKLKESFTKEKEYFGE